MGELVLTTLGRMGSPLLRYRTGDLVREDVEMAASEDHHDLRLQGGILGRVDDMVLVRGVNLYPAAVENLMLSFQEVAAYQVEIDCRGPMVELVLRVEPGNALADTKEFTARIQSHFRAAFNLRVPVTVCARNAATGGDEIT